MSDSDGSSTPTLETRDFLDELTSAESSLNSFFAGTSPSSPLQKKIQRGKKKRRKLLKKKAPGVGGSPLQEELKIPFSQRVGEVKDLDLQLPKEQDPSLVPARDPSESDAGLAVGLAGPMKEEAFLGARASMVRDRTTAERRPEAFEVAGAEGGEGEEESDKAASCRSLDVVNTTVRKADTSSLGSAEASTLTTAVLRWKIKKFPSKYKSGEAPLFSPLHEDDLKNKWRFILYPKGEKGDDWLSVFIEVPESERLPFGWKRSASFTITLAHGDGDKEFSRKDSHVFKSTGGDTSWGWPNFIECSRLFKEGYCVNDSIEIRAEILLHSMSNHIAKEDLCAYLCSACATGNARNVNYCIDRGADVNDMYKSNAPIHNVCMATKPFPDILNTLLNKGADIDLVNGDVESGLLLAAYYGHISIVNLLLARGARRDIGPTKNGLCCVGAAAQQGELEALKLLLEAGAPIEGLGAGCCVPLKQALQLKKWTCAKHLIKSGARNTPYSASDEDYFIFAARHAPADVVFCLAENGADVNVCDKNGETPLSILLFNRSEPELAYHLWHEFGASIARCSRDRQKVQRAKLLLTLEHKKTLGAGPRDTAFEFIASQLSEDCLPLLKLLESKKFSISHQAAQFVKNRMHSKDELAQFLFQDPSYHELFEDTDLTEFGLDPRKLQQLSEEFLNNKIAERAARADKHAQELIQEEEAEEKKKMSKAQKKKQKKKKKKAALQAKKQEEEMLKQKQKEEEDRRQREREEEHRRKQEEKERRRIEEKEKEMQQQMAQLALKSKLKHKEKNTEKPKEKEKAKESTAVEASQPKEPKELPSAAPEKARKKKKKKQVQQVQQVQQSQAAGSQQQQDNGRYNLSTAKSREKSRQQPTEKDFDGTVTKIFGGANGYLFVNYKIYCSREIVQEAHEWPPKEGDRVKVRAVWDPDRENWRGTKYKLVSAPVPKKDEKKDVFNDFYAAARTLDKLIQSVGGSVVYTPVTLNDLLRAGTAMEKSLVETAASNCSKGLAGLVERFPDLMVFGTDAAGSLRIVSRAVHAAQPSNSPGPVVGQSRLSAPPQPKKKEDVVPLPVDYASAVAVTPADLKQRVAPHPNSIPHSTMDRTPKPDPDGALGFHTQIAVEQPAAQPVAPLESAGIGNALLGAEVGVDEPFGRISEQICNSVLEIETDPITKLAEESVPATAPVTAEPPANGSRLSFFKYLHEENEEPVPPPPGMPFMAPSQPPTSELNAESEVFQGFDNGYFLPGETAQAVPTTTEAQPFQHWSASPGDLWTDPLGALHAPAQATAASESFGKVHPHSHSQEAQRQNGVSDFVKRGS